MARSKNAIRSIAGLPDWFKIENYEDTNRLNIQDWCKLISERIDCIRMLKVFPTINLATGLNFIEEFPELISAIEMMRKNPLEKPEQGPPRKRNKHHSPFEFPTIRTMSYNDLFKAIAAAHENCEKSTSDIIRAFDIAKKYGALPVDIEGIDWWELHEKPITEHRVAYSLIPITVNLSLSKDIIIEAFSMWLDKALVGAPTEKIKTTPKKRPNHKRFTEQDFNKWHNYGLIPYLDLHIWQLETGKKIRKKVIARVISSHAKEIDESTVVTTISKYVSGFLNGTSLRKLTAQAEHEKAQVATDSTPNQLVKK